MHLGEGIKKLGFGLMRLPMIGKEVDIEQTRQMVDLFMEKGFTYFDTAHAYLEGKSEVAIGEALVKRYPRESYQLATKMPAWLSETAEGAKDMFWTSLARTGAGYFDFYLLHNLGVGRTGAFDDFGIWDFAEEQKKEGRIRHLGFSMHATADHLEEVLAKHPEVEFVQLQINYSDWENRIIQSGKCYEVARKYGKPVVVMEPVKGGLLANLPEGAAEVLATANPNASPASWAIRFAASLEGIVTVLSGMSTLEQMRDNVSRMEAFEPLSARELETVREVQKILSGIPQIPCTDCRYCMEKCPQHIAIPGTFKSVNDYLIYHNLTAAQWNYTWETRSLGKASTCVRCGNCEVACPQSIPVMQELAKAAEILEAQA